MPKRVDSNQREIVNAFRDRGLSVLVMSNLGHGAPDIAVGTNGMTFLFEIKDGSRPLSAQRLTPLELKFFNEWHGHIEIINSIDDVNKFIDRIKNKFHL